MKKIIAVLIILILSFWNLFAYVNNYELTSKDRKIINKISSKISILLSKNNLSFRKVLLVLKRNIINIMKNIILIMIR